MEIALFILGIILSVPAGLLTNSLFQRIYRPMAMIQFDNPTPLQRGFSRMTALQRRLRGKSAPIIVDVITDGKFIDSAIFFISVIDAAKQTSGVIFRLKQVDWDAIPHVLSQSSSAIGYVNRREFDDIDGDVELWGNLCSFHGYALVGRSQDFPAPINTLEEANEALRRLSTSRKLELLNYGSDSLKVLRTPLTPILFGPKIDYRTYAIDDGLARFLRGQGDLYIGGLPQRLECARRGMVEILTSQIHPLMIGINCLVFKGLGAEVDILDHVSVSWSRVCRRLIADEDYCREIYERWQRSSEALGMSPSFSIDDLILVAHGEPTKYLRFFVGRDDAAMELIRATNIVLADDVALKVQRKDRKAIMGALHSIFDGNSG